MTDERSETPEPRGTERASTAEVGEPSRPTRGAEQRDDVHVDLDARQDRLSQRRKEAGPRQGDTREESPDEEPPAGDETNPAEPD